MTVDGAGSSRAHRQLAELTRQGIHIVSGAWALLLRWIEPWPLMLLALAATLFNQWGLPRLGGRWLWRRPELEVGRAPGVVLYPLSVLTLLSIFYARPEIAAVGWGLLAFADGAATLAGLWGRGPVLPWNPAKTWLGSLAYLGVGWLSSWALIGWVAPGRYPPDLVLWVTAAVALMAALLESAPQRLDDNLRVPLLAALLLWCLLETEGHWVKLNEPEFFTAVAVGLAINALLVIAAYGLGTLDRAGAVAACCIGSTIFAFLSWPGYGVLLVFFVLGSVSTRLGFATKDRRRLAQAEGGRRQAANVLANGGVAAACAVFAGLTPHDSIFVLAYAASLAAAAADTVESEIGQVWGGRTVLITSFEPVAPGTDGGISLVGSVAGLVAGLATAAAGSLLGLYSPISILPVALAGFLATLVESLVGATVERRGLLDNHGVNLVNTLLAALLAVAWVRFVG